MHPLRETIKISGERGGREREGDGGAGRPPFVMAAARSFAIRDSAYAPISTSFFRVLSVSKHFHFLFQFHFIPLPPLVSLSSTPFLWSFCPSTFIPVVLPSPLLLLFLFFFLLFLLRPRLARIRGTRGKFRKGESEWRRTKGARDGTSTRRATLLRALWPFTAGSEGTRLRAYVRAKSVSKMCSKGAGGASTRGESENLRAIAIRARVHCAKFRRNREGVIDNER